MSKLTTTLFAVFAGAGLIAVPAFAAPGDVMLSATLNGAAETPPTTGNATGMFMGRLNAVSGQLCYTLTSENLPALTMAHIHVGALGVAGPPVVVLAPSVPSETCMAVDKDLAAKITATPGDYYVNVHNTPYPKGAIRGQLTQQ
jgi:hypothetical protein